MSAQFIATVEEFQAPHPKAGKRAVKLIIGDGDALLFYCYLTADEAEKISEGLKEMAQHARGKLIVVPGNSPLPPPPGRA